MEGRRRFELSRKKDYLEGEKALDEYKGYFKLTWLPVHDYWDEKDTRHSVA